MTKTNSRSDMIWARDRRELAIEDLRDFESGERAPHEMRDAQWTNISPEWIDRLKREIEALDQLIAASEG